MKIFRVFLIYLLTVCASAPTRSFAQDLDTKYYYGDVEMSSPDGGTFYGKTVSLVKRIVDPANNSISEIVLQPPRNPQEKPRDVHTTLTRIGSSNVFWAVDDAHSFEGKLTFEGDDWLWDHWSYEIRLLDGSSLRGIGLLDSEGIKTRKLFYTPDGTPSVLLKETLNIIESTEYDRRHREMLGE